MTATLKAGELAYLCTIHSGLIACRVLRVYKSELDDLADHAQVDVVVTAARKSAWPKGTRPPARAWSSRAMPSEVSASCPTRWN